MLVQTLDIKLFLTYKDGNFMWFYLIDWRGKKQHPANIEPLLMNMMYTVMWKFVPH